MQPIPKIVSSFSNIPFVQCLHVNRYIKHLSSQLNLYFTLYFSLVTVLLSVSISKMATYISRFLQLLDDTTTLCKGYSLPLTS